VEQYQGDNKCDEKCADGSHKDACGWVEEIDAYRVADDAGAAVDHAFCHRTGKLGPVFFQRDEHG